MTSAFERAASSLRVRFESSSPGNDNLHMIARVVGAMASAVASGQTWDEATLRFRAFVGIPWGKRPGARGRRNGWANALDASHDGTAHAAELNVAREADAAAEAGDEDAFLRATSETSRIRSPTS